MTVNYNLNFVAVIEIAVICLMIHANTPMITRAIMVNERSIN